MSKVRVCINSPRLKFSGSDVFPSGLIGNEDSIYCPNSCQLSLILQLREEICPVSH